MMRTFRLVAGLLAITSLAVVLASPAGAQQTASITGEVTCLADGTYSVEVTVTNNGSESADVTGNWEATDASIAIIGGGPLTFSPANVAAGGTTTASFIAPADSAAVAVQGSANYSQVVFPFGIGLATADCVAETTTTTTTSAASTPTTAVAPAVAAQARTVQPTFTG